ncbi:DNA internalization-related competence protein ComEC/Rec2 [Neisseriaceae bacterium ESL0693]|nr:DNA internalization-related competence protein ComEC/Rec2 [Neisseriaceae bacterium ESL0693]
MGSYRQGLAWIPCWVMGVWVSFLLPVFLAQPVYWLGAAVVGLVVLVWPPLRWLACVVAVCLGVAFGLWQTQTVLHQQWPLNQARVMRTVQLSVADIVQTDGRRSRFLARVWTSQQPPQIWLVNDYQQQSWRAGDCWQVAVRVRPVVGEVNRVGFNAEAWALSNHIVAMATIKGERTACHATRRWQSELIRWRTVLGQRWQQQRHDYPQGVALLKALTVGDQAALPDEAWQIFRPLGINHLVSISGLHVGMLAMLFAWLCKILLRYLPLPINEPWRYVRATAVVVAVIYSGLAGFAVPTQRSMLMIIVLALTWRRGHLAPMQLWWLVMAMVLLYDSLAVLSVGFWLSFLLVAALMWAGSGYLYLSRIRQGVQAQWASGLASVVLVSYVFGSVAVLSPLVNAVAIPWFTLVLVPVALLSLFLPWPPLLTLAAWLSEWTMQALHWIAQYAPQYYPAQAPALLWLLSVLAVLILLLPRGLWLRPLCCLLVVMLLTYRPSKPEHGQVLLTVWDVGQGLSLSLETAHHTLIFDTGTAHAAQSDLVPNLQALGIKKLDMLVLSHHDTDHDGGADLIRDQFHPHQIVAGQANAYHFAAKPCYAGLNWQWDGVWFEFLNQPVKAKARKNDHSCVLRVVAADKAVMIMGDLSKTGERSLIQAYGRDLYSQILILGHHGSHTSSSEEFLQQVSPQFAVASAGFANPYRHPHADVVDLLAQNHVHLLRTDSMGAVQTLLSEAPIHWHTLRQHKPYWQRKPWQRPE